VHRAVLVTAILSVCLSVTFRCFVQMNEDTIVRFSASGTTIPLVSGEVTFILIFAVSVSVCVHTCTGVSIAGESVATCTRVLSRSRHLTVSVLITRRGDLLPVITQLTRSHLAQAHVDSYTQSQRHCQLLSFIHSQIWFPTDFQEFPRDILTTSR